MKKLFKEVFKSLKKNKVVVFGLTMLILLTTGIFTLLSDAGKSLQNQYNEYRKKSNAHNITVDLDLKTNGNAFNDGFYINSLVRNKENSDDYKKPLKYIEIKDNKPNFVKGQNIIDFSRWTSENNNNAIDNYNNSYIELTNFFNPQEKEQYKNLYIKKDDFQKLYNFYIPEFTSDEQPLIDLNFKNKVKSMFVKNNYWVDVYQKLNNNTYELKKQSISLSKSQNPILHFDKEYKLSDFVFLTIGENKIYASQASDIYLNLSKNNQMTLNPIIYNEWLTNKDLVYVIKGDQVLNKLGFVKDGDDVYSINPHSLNNSDILEMNPNVMESKFKNDVPYSALIDQENIEATNTKSFLFAKNQSYIIPTKWASIKKEYTFYDRTQYTNTFDEYNKDKWSGTYVQSVENLLKSKQIPRSFSYWNKTIKNVIFDFNEITGELNAQPNLNSKLNFEINPVVSFDEVNKAPLLLYQGDLDQVNLNKVAYNGKTLLDIYHLDNPETIAEITLNNEKNINDRSKLSNNEYNNITNKNINDYYFTYIKNEASNITNKKIYDELMSKLNISSNDIGIRETLTVDAFENNQKFVYHLVNQGDSKRSILNIPINVDKLVNEIDNPTILNKIADDVTNVFKSKTLPAYVSYIILQQSKNNVTPDPKYIRPDFDYQTVNFIDYRNNQITPIYNAKVYKLINNEDDPSKQPTNLGVFWFNDKLVLLHVVLDENKNFLYWENYNTKSFNNVNAEFSLDEFLQYLTQNKLTLGANLPNPDGWIEVSDSFTNNVYIPFGYRSPLSEIEVDARINGSFSTGASLIQKALLDTDLVKNGFLTKEEVYGLTNALLKGANLNGASRVLSSGEINLNILPKWTLDTIYFATHNSNRNYLQSIMNTFLNRIKQKILEQPLDQQKEYLGTQIEKLFNFIKHFTNVDFNEWIFQPKDVIKLIKDPVDLINSLILIFNSFDWVHFSDLSHQFFINDYNKYYDENGQEISKDQVSNDKDNVYQRKLSLYEMFIWILDSINQNEFKKGLLNILNNVDTSLLDNQHLMVFSFFNKLPKNFINIINQFNAYKNDASNSYKNIIDGLKFFINIFDLNVFKNTLMDKIKLNNFSIQGEIYKKDIDAFLKVTRYYRAGSFMPSDLAYAVLRGFFNQPGSNRRIKEEIIKMFNLSSAAKVIDLGQNERLAVPSSDPKKVDYFDLLDLLNNGPSTNKSKDKLNLIKNLVEKFQNDKFINIDTLKNDERKILSEILNKKELTKENVEDLLLQWSKILPLFAFKQQNQLTPNDEIGTLFYVLNNAAANPEPSKKNSLLILNLFNKLLGDLDNYDLNDLFTFTKDGYALFNVFWKVLGIKGLDFVQKNQLNNLLLALANNPNTLNSFNSFELFQPSSSNIIGASRTGFGITRSIANIEKMRELFFAKENNHYSNVELEKIAALNYNYREFIEQNELALTKLFSYIGLAHLYYLDNINTDKKYPDIFSNVFDNLINGVFQNEAILNNYDSINNVLNKDYQSLSLEKLGISDILLNRLLRKKVPQIIIWLLTDATKVNNQNVVGNIAYLINNKIVNFEEITNNEEKAYEFIYSFIKKYKPSEIPSPVFEKDFVYKLSIDDDYLNTLYKRINQNANLNNPFDINLANVLEKMINSITTVNYSFNIAKFNQPSSYIAKVNYAFLEKNNKEIYKGIIPSDPILINELVTKLDSKYKININGSEFIIIGDDFSYDYIYPIINEENLQVNPQNQAVVFVNDKGFDRIKQAYRGNVIKKYLLVKSNNPNLEQEKENIQNLVDRLVPSNNKIKNVYLATELDPINPERSIRVSTVEGIVNSIKSFSLTVLITLIILVAISTIFIIKRYISNKNKVIGILVAQGYKPIEIGLSLTTFAFFTIFIGGVLGFIIGFSLHGVALSLIKNFWTIPIQTIQFNFLSLLVSILIPIVAMSILIILISLRSLKYKSIDLMSGIADLSVGNIYQKFYKILKRRNVKTKFSMSLTFNSFFKLVSFGISAILASVTTIFAFSLFGIFDKTINDTYINRRYNYKYDLTSPTSQGGLLNTYQIDKKTLEDSLYVPIGTGSEIDSYQNNYFKPGFSSVINAKAINKQDQGLPNGNPNPYSPHIISQFSVSIKINTSVSIDPFNVVYNSLPDTQKIKILNVRDKVGYALEKTQEGLVYVNGTNEIDLEQTYLNLKKLNKELGFFKYVANKNKIIDGKFWYFKWNENQNEFEQLVISTDYKRQEYRDFLVNGYAKIYADPNQKVQDFFVSFGGIYVNPKFDEVYTYVDSKTNNNLIKIYGYKQNSKYVFAYDALNYELLNSAAKLYKENKAKNIKEIPLIVNSVAADLYGLKTGSILNLPVYNKYNRYTNAITHKEVVNNNELYKFKVYGINTTYINSEFIIPKEAADDLLINKDLKEKLLSDIHKYDKNYEFFNGIVSTSVEPEQLVWSTGLYSPSGYWPSSDTYSLTTLNDENKISMFNALFGSSTLDPSIHTPGVLQQQGFSDKDIILFLRPDANINGNLPDLYKELRNEILSSSIEKYSNIFNDNLYIPIAFNLNAKNIEIGFTESIGSVAQKVITIISILSFAISILILIIISTILINENEKNIAIWSVLGYSTKEKIKMFFFIYVPFIIISLIIALPLAFGIMYLFASFLTSTVAISLPLVLTAKNVMYTILIVFGAFILTSVISWININKIKAINLLKSK
ncbi:FtsX-like permease family protein [Mycoplasma sp. NEAQ87857]|uniref:ABC transporter permease n=1 Tax=Mycoplasma sp. NEAQ87857 TaxID=2683967 RepID=UPI001317CB40|nr:ABC transporter permease [Mycoplasma sp. NEAQ87857]QGZ97996.1 FtsX-like permease family protein [Mycoplasma sp. NEAQ87857]